MVLRHPERVKRVEGSSMDKIEKLVIIGSGPAGLTAAIYSSRAGLNPLVVAGREAGGQLMLTTDVDDFPGFPEGIQGPELMERMRKQAERFDTRFLSEDILDLDLSQNPFIIKTETSTLHAATLIVATGASAMWLGLESEKRLMGRGVSACAVCDGFFFKGKDIAVIGGGDTAMREAQYLSKICKKVYVIHRRGELRAQTALQELVKSKENVEFILSSVVEEFIGEEKLSAVKIKNLESGEVKDLLVEGAFVAIGHKPNTHFLHGKLELDEKGYIKIEGVTTKTSVPGVFWAGDVGDTLYKQAVTAAGAGCKAAFDAEGFLENK